MNKIRMECINTSLGEVLVGEYEGKVCLLNWKQRKIRNQIDRRIQGGIKGVYVVEHSKLFDLLEKQLDEYLSKKREIFELPFIMVGSEFQKSVWKTLQTIPYGQTESYLGLAKRLNNPGAVRAVGSANGANAISIIIPCHRIINSNGSLGGYGGGLAVKEKLLRLEGSW